MNAEEYNKHKWEFPALRTQSPIPQAKPDPMVLLDSQVQQLQNNVARMREGLAKLQVSFENLETANRQLRQAVINLQLALQRGHDAT